MKINRLITSSSDSGGNDRYIAAKFHLKIGKNLFTHILVLIDCKKKLIEVKRRFAINPAIKVKICQLAEIRHKMSTDSWIELESLLLADPDRQHLLAKKLYHFSLIIKPEDCPTIPGKTVDFVTNNFEIYEKWITKLETLLQRHNESESVLHCNQDRMLQHHYKTRINTKNIILSNNFFALKKFIRSLSIDITANELERVLKMQNYNALASISCEDYRNLMHQFDDRTALNYIFYKYSIAKSELMNAAGLCAFFRNEQGTQKSESDCERLIDRYTSNKQNKEEEEEKKDGKSSKRSTKYLRRKQFYRMFDSEPEQFALFDARHAQVWQDMSQPMTHYFIASSHNSYLTGNQLTSGSSYEMYRIILLSGCRCVEIDVWNGDVEPMVYHGHTLTSKITLRGVLKVIDEVAFRASQYPLILSIENHLNLHNQQQMADMMRQILGDKLYTKPVPSNATRFPSPKEMMGKIFIKASKSDKYVLAAEKIVPAKKRKRKALTKTGSIIKNDFESDDEDIETDDEDDDDDKQQVNSQINRNETFANSQTSNQLSECNLVDDKEQKDEDTSNKVQTQTWQTDGFRKASNKIIASEFSRLINYFQARSFVSIEQCIEKFKFYEMFSRNESQSNRILTNDRVRYRRLASTNMVRVYPHGSRVQSSNYIPLDHWDAGAQIVALNYQTNSFAMLINRALFALNGGCGYVAKPRALVDPSYDAEPADHITELRIQILSGLFFWPLFFESKRSDSDPAAQTELKVSIRVYCPGKDERADLKKPQSTKVITGNAFNPCWNETFIFELSNAQLSFVSFTLVDGGTLCGHYIIALSAMRKGYRFIELHDKNLQKIPFARIYLHIDYQRPQ